MWLEMIVDNLQAGKSCEPHNIQSNIQQNEEEEVPGEKIPITKALHSSSSSDTSVIHCTHVQDMRYNMQELSVKMSIQRAPSF